MTTNEATIVGLTMKYGARLTVVDAAAALSVSETHLKNRINMGKIKIVRDGKLVRITAEEVARYARESQQ